MKKQSALGRLLWLYEPFWRYARGYVILSLVFWAVILPLHRILMVIFPETVVNLITGGYGIQTLVGVVVVFQLLLLGIPIFEDFYNAYGKDKMEAKVELSIKRQVYEKALQTDYRYVDDPKYYHTYMWAIHHQAEKAKEAFALLNRAVSALILIVSLAGIVSMFSPWMVLLTVLSMVLRTYGYMKYNRQDVAREQELMHSSRKLDYYHRIFYMKDYNADLKTTKLRDFVFRHFNHEASHRLEVIHGYAKGLTRWAVFSDMIYRVFMTVIILAVALNLASGDVGEAASYITIMLSIEKMEDAMYEFFELFQQGGKLSLYARDIQAFYHMESQIETEGASSQAMPPSGSFDIKFTHLCFQYAHSDFKIDSLNLHIRAGEKIAIVGENGTGKSTLVKLLLRLYDPQSGDIAINGKSIKDYSLPALRRQIGVVFQDTHVYAMSFKENVELYRPVTSEDMPELIDKAQLRGMLQKNEGTPESLMTKEFDENGMVCSVGEEQKIGWARVLGGNFGLLILDEPSSALDPIAEYEMNQLLFDSRSKATTIMVAHRLSTIRNADRIIVMDKGRICESGSHDELMSQKGRYYEMFMKQAENYN